MKKLIFIFMLIIAGTAVCLAIVADVIGKWSGNLVLPEGTMPITYTFKADGSKLTGNVLYNSNELPITDGKIKGDSLIFNVDYNGELIPHTGRVYADSVALDATLNNTNFHISLKRDNN